MQPVAATCSSMAGTCLAPSSTAAMSGFSGRSATDLKDWKPSTELREGLTTYTRPWKPWLRRPSSSWRDHRVSGEAPMTATTLGLKNASTVAAS